MDWLTERLRFMIIGWAASAVLIILGTFFYSALNTARSDSVQQAIQSCTDSHQDAAVHNGSVTCFVLRHKKIAPTPKGRR